MGSIIQNVRYAFRMLGKNPGFTAVAILSLGLGIGANTAIFTLINSLMLKSLPVHEPQQLVSLGKSTGGGEVTASGRARWIFLLTIFISRLSRSMDRFREFADTVVSQ